MPRSTHRIALLAPVSPVRSALVDHIEGLLPGLAMHYDVTLVTDGTYEAAPQYDLGGKPIACIPISTFDQQSDDFDLIIYQLGDEANIHGYQFDRLYRLPGLVLLNDLVIHHALVERTLNRGDIAAYLAEMQHAYGQRGVAAAHQVITGQESERVFSAFPLCERVVQSSLATVGFNGYMCAELRRHCPRAAIYETHYGFFMPECTHNTPESTSRGAQIGTFGIFNSQKRLELALDAFHVIAQRHPQATYHLVGARRDDAMLANSIASRGLSGRIVPSGWLDRPAFCAMMRQMDLAVQLRWPHVGGTPYTPIRLLGVGVPTIISDIEPLAEMPDDAVVRIKPDTPDEKDQLVAAMDYLLSHQDIAGAMAARGQAFIRSRHSQQDALDKLCNTIDEVIANKAQLAERTSPSLAQPKPLGDASDLLIPIAAAAMAELGLATNDTAAGRPIARAIADLTRTTSTGLS